MQQYQIFTGRYGKFCDLKYASQIKEIIVADWSDSDLKESRADRQPAFAIFPVKLRDADDLALKNKLAESLCDMLNAKRAAELSSPVNVAW